MKEIAGKLNAEGRKFGVVVSRFNEMVTERLLDGALAMFRRAGAREEDLTVVRVPGSFELAIAAQQLAASQNFDAIVCLGALIKGETDHYDHLASAVTRSIAEVSLKTGVPVAFGVITAATVDQALNRAGLKHGNKGSEAAAAAIEMAHVRRGLQGS